MKQILNKKILCFLLGVVVLFAAAWPAVATMAEEDRFIEWEQGSKANRVNVSVNLLKNERLDDITTLQIRFYLNGKDVRDAFFVFDSKIKDNKEITVKESRYNSDGQTLTVYLSGRDIILKKGSVKKLGYIEVDSASNVEVIVAEDSGKMVDLYNDQSPVLELGATTSYNMYLNNEKPDTTTTDSSDSSGNSSNASLNWDRNGSDWKFKKSDGSYAANEWMMVDGKWYWFGADGVMATGWIKVNDAWYYCAPSGDMKTGWVKDNNKWYYCGRSGSMKTGWIEDKTMWYYLNPDGSMKTGWVQDQDKWYYMTEDGSMLSNEVTPDGYRVDRNGVFTK